MSLKNRRMGKNNVVNLHIEIMEFAGKWMKIEKKIILGELTQTQKDKYVFNVGISC